jgi:hypothetical protein
MTSTTERDVPLFAGAPAVLEALSNLLPKKHVSLGSATPAQRASALGPAAFALPAETVLRKADVNGALRPVIGGACRLLNTDPMELRCWLVDACWLNRDGFGRAYRRAGVVSLSPVQAQIAAAWRGTAGLACASQMREDEAFRRAERKNAWVGRPEDDSTSRRAGKALASGGRP